MTTIIILVMKQSCLLILSMTHQTKMQILSWLLHSTRRKKKKGRNRHLSKTAISMPNSSITTTTTTTTQQATITATHAFLLLLLRLRLRCQAIKHILTQLVKLITRILRIIITLIVKKNKTKMRLTVNQMRCV